jgi:hypothetical protein
MKKAFHTILKLLLVLTIFWGLQGRVIIRYAEIFYKNHRTEQANAGNVKIRAGIIHCKLQCYTQHFHKLYAPLALLLLVLIVAPVVTILLYISHKERYPAVYPIRLIPLRAPPVF